jgi:UDP-N-acetylmuramate: L-alanyl-gamma-D-glutamyl-meso-diaminopimelate ligase
MDSCNHAIVYFSHHALQLKGLPELQTDVVKQYFKRDDLTVIDNKTALEETVKNLLNQSPEPTCLLLMSSGTFDGIDWNSVSSH